MIRSSPQFGFTLVAYEYLHKVRTTFRQDERLLNLGFVVCPSVLPGAVTLGVLYTRD